MKNEEINQAFAKLSDAIQRDDDKAGREVLIALGSNVIGNLQRIADALDHIARNIPAPK